MDYQEKIAKAKQEIEKATNSLLMEFTVKTVKDERVCNNCKNHEGDTDDVYNAVIGVNYPPFHDDCRCYATYEVKGIRK